ncbi:hypothetical protein SEA_DIZZYRUDY_55 [Microbacterium phage DizzyRudy]|nr:hypothetical protein SEA_DIZZYRUDY_55 [Microbacterium phage DizzyRudy]
MEGTEEFWDAYYTELERARFSLIAAQLLAEEAEKIEDIPTLRDFKRRHGKHIRSVYRHLRLAAKFRKKIERFEKKASKANG